MILLSKVRSILLRGFDQQMANKIGENEYATFVDKNTIKTVNKKGVEKTVTASKFILATGGRPKYPNIPGAEFGISRLEMKMGKQNGNEK